MDSRKTEAFATDASNLPCNLVTCKLLPLQTQDEEDANDEQIKKECEKIFHPERFEFHELTTSLPTIETPNIDLGAVFYAQQQQKASEQSLLDQCATSWTPYSEQEETKRVTFEDAQNLDNINRYRKYGRSFSTQDTSAATPSFSPMRRTSTTVGSLENLNNGHNQESYPHVHHVMSRRRPSMTTSNEKEKQPRKPRVIPEGIASLPTIEDVEETKPARKKSLTPVKQDSRIRTISVTSKESPEKSLDVTQEAEDADEEEPEDNEQVTFTLGLQTDEEVMQERQRILDHAAKTRKKKKKRTKRRSSKFSEDELKMRSFRGSELSVNVSPSLPTDKEEAMMLERKDLDDITHHRFDHWQGLSRHKINKKSSSGANLMTIAKSTGTAKAHEDQRLLLDSMYEQEKQVDHSPHNVFVELDELIGDEWVEQSRWIKYEEAREAGSERWGKPHVSSLSFHSLLNLRLSLEKGAVLLDHEGKDMTNVMSSIVNELIDIGYIDDDTGSELLRVLLFRHKYVDSKLKMWRSGMRNHSVISLSDNGTDEHESSYLHRFSRSFSRHHDSEFAHQIKHLLDEDHHKVPDVVVTPDEDLPSGPNFQTQLSTKDYLSIDMDHHGRTGSTASFTTTPSFGGDLHKLYDYARKHSIMMRVPEDTEGALSLVGALDIIEEPLTAFVRLEEGIIMPNSLEIPLPMRFIFLLLTPKNKSFIDGHEVGRSFSALMSNRRFHNVCYRIEERRELLSAINDFLDESVVLPPGDWDSKNLLSMSEIQELRNRKKGKKKDMDDFEKRKPEPETSEKCDTYESNPLIRAPFLFGGLVNDIKRRSKYYWSDIKDGFNSQVIAAAVFIYFASLSGAIAFGGLLGEKTGNLIGISETLVLSSVAALIFALFSGAPLIITGVTGPLLLYDESLFNICKENEIDYLAIRFWTGVWMVVISLLVAMFQGSILVKYFTRFTKDLFKALVSLLYIFEALKKLGKVYSAHPLAEISHYCNQTINEDPIMAVKNQEPNTALLTTMLMFGTFCVAYALRAVKGSHFLGRTARKSLGDFGVPIAIVIMVVVDMLIEETYTEKLKVPMGLQVTTPDQRNWLISPMGQQIPIESWMPIAASLPAILLYLLLFVEVHICELLMLEKTGNLKGAGVHWDIVLLSLINCLSALLGGPWICAATVRGMAHVSALTVMSTTHAPGETPKVVEVKDQRLSGLIVAVLIGASIYLSPFLKHIPYAVLFGVFLYMGISSMSGIQFFDRCVLFLLPVKHHGHASYVRRVRTVFSLYNKTFQLLVFQVKTLKMHLFTILQFLGLVVLWVVKSSALALAFPFFVVGMVPYRLTFKLFFTPRELEAVSHI